MSDEPEIYRLLMMLRTGGYLLRAIDCPEKEVQRAKAENRYTIDGDGYAFVWRPGIAGSGQYAKQIPLVPQKIPDPVIIIDEKDKKTKAGTPAWEKYAKLL